MDICESGSFQPRGWGSAAASGLLPPFAQVLESSTQALSGKPCRDTTAVYGIGAGSREYAALKCLSDRSLVPSYSRLARPVLQASTFAKGLQLIQEGPFSIAGQAQKFVTSTEVVKFLMKCITNKCKAGDFIRVKKSELLKIRDPQVALDFEYDVLGDFDASFQIYFFYAQSASSGIRYPRFICRPLPPTNYGEGDPVTVLLQYWATMHVILQPLVYLIARYFPTPKIFPDLRVPKMHADRLHGVLLFMCIVSASKQERRS